MTERDTNGGGTALAADDVIPGEWHLRYNYSIGEVGATFFNELRNKRIVASRCSKSGLTYLPPRAYCERSFERCDEWVEVGPEGTVEAATIVSVPFNNTPEPPYAIAYVRLDGASTAMVNYVKGLDLSDVPRANERLRPGARVRTAFEDTPQGRVADFHYELID